MSNNLIAVYGDLGSGKTLFCTLLQEIAFYQNITSYSNYNEIHAVKFNLNDFIHEKYQNCLTVIDEGYMISDSRDSSNLMNRLISYVAFQSRKRNNCIVFAFQLLQSIDVRLRKLFSLFVFCQKEIDGFSYLIYNRYGKSKRIKLRFEKLQYLFDCYNTYEVIEQDESFYGSIETKEDRLNRLLELSKKVKKEYGFEITKLQLRKYLLNHKLNVKDLPDIYALIKD